MAPAPTALVFLSPSDLEALLARAAETGARAALSERRTVEVSPWITADEVAPMLGYGRRSIAKLVRSRGLPCHRVGRLLRFRRDEVEAWRARGGRP